MSNLVNKHSISFELAQTMVSAAVAKAREIGVSENVVILDDGGNLKAFGRMDGAPLPTIEMARLLVSWPADRRRAPAGPASRSEEMPSGLGHHQARTESRLGTR
jgi:hypothetical protein